LFTTESHKDTLTNAIPIPIQVIARYTSQMFGLSMLFISKVLFSMQIKVVRYFQRNNLCNDLSI